jgi:iron complex transport system ATP-binding protein
MSDLLVVRDLALTIRRRVILQGVTFSVRAGEKVAIVGANGAGKSTLIKTIAGLHREYQGCLDVAGHSVNRASPKLLSTLLSFVPQRLLALPRVTVKEFFEIHGASDRSESGLAYTEHLLGRYLPDLSGGELQRVLLASALSQGAKLLLLDEPTAHLDPTGRSKIQQMIVECHNQQATTCVLVTHDISLATQASDRILVMREGRIDWDGAASDAGLLPALERAYGCGFIELARAHEAARLIIPL